MCWQSPKSLTLRTGPRQSSRPVRPPSFSRSLSPNRATMQLPGVLVVLCVSLSTAYGIQCYTCLASDSQSCTEVTTCASPLNRCFSINVGGLLTKGCQTSYACLPGMGCCEGDLCNSAIAFGPSAILLLVSSVILTLCL